MLSSEFEKDLQSVFEYGFEVFGLNAAEQYRQHILALSYGLSNYSLMYPECRHIPTKGHIYRNIILESHLIIYRVKAEQIDILGVFHSKSSISKIRAVRKIKI